MVLRLTALFALLAAVASAQTQTVPSAPTVQHVICDSGCGGGTTDTDDGSIATGQTGAVSLGLTQIYNGATWARLTFGQAVMASSLPVTIASNQSALSVTATNSFLLDATFTARINTLGQKTMANSTPVVLASDQAAIPVNQGTSPWVENISQYGGAATSLGQKTASSSVPVVPASDYVGGANMEGTVTFNTPGAACPAVSTTAVTTSTGCMQIPVFGNTGAAVEIQAGLTGTWIAEHTFDPAGATWATSIVVAGVTQTSGATAIAGARTEINWFVPEGAVQVRVRLTVYTSGSAVVWGRATKLVSPLSVGALCGGVPGTAATTWACLQGGIIRTAVPAAGTALTGAMAAYDPYGHALIRLDHLNRFRCVMDSSATTSTVITGCAGSIATMAAPGAGLALYITDISFYNSIVSTTTNRNVIQSGTGGTCGTGTSIMWAGYNSAVFSGSEHTFNTPLRATTNGEVCFLDAGTAQKLITISGYVAP